MRKFASKQRTIKQASKQANVSNTETTLILCGYSRERANNRGDSTTDSAGNRIFSPQYLKKISLSTPQTIFFSKREPKGDLFRLKIISEGTKLVFICPMQGLLLSFIVIAASKFLDFSSCPFVPPPPPCCYCIQVFGSM